MDNLLRYAYFPQRCNQCGGEYAWTLEQLFEEQQMQGEATGRPCSACHSEWLSLIDSVPPDTLAELQRAWHEMATAARERGLRLEVGLLRTDGE